MIYALRKFCPNPTTDQSQISWVKGKKDVMNKKSQPHKRFSPVCSEIFTSDFVSLEISHGLFDDFRFRNFVFSFCTVRTHRGPSEQDQTKVRHRLGPKGGSRLKRVTGPFWVHVPLPAAQPQREENSLEGRCSSSSKHFSWGGLCFQAWLTVTRARWRDYLDLFVRSRSGNGGRSGFPSWFCYSHSQVMDKWRKMNILHFGLYPALLHMLMLCKELIISLPLPSRQVFIFL